MDITIWLAFAAGFIAFISPCCLPLYPSFISYISGVTVAEIKKQESPLFVRKKILLHSIYFSLGFTIVYFAMGFSASLVGRIFREYNDLIRMVGGIFLIVMGLFMLEIFQPKFLMKEHRFQHTTKKVGFLNSILVGIVFGAGWSPCIGPIFGAIMYANLIDPTKTFINVTAYSLGFCIPFVVMAFFISKTKILLKYSSRLMKVGGVLMIVIGFVVFFDKMTYLTIWNSELQTFIENWFNKKK